MKFYNVLAASIHDIKNSLSLVINTLEELVEDPENRFSDPRKVHALRQEAVRSNNNLMQLLTFYKFDEEEASSNVLEHNMEDFLEEIVAENAALSEALEVSIESKTEEHLSAYLDEDLVRGVLNSAIDNARRYTQDRVLISAVSEDGYVVIRVEDNGKGFPGQMLELQKANAAHDAFRSGRTELGLLFARKIAAFHEADHRTGFVRLRNGHQLSGGCFEMWLP